MKLLNLWPQGEEVVRPVKRFAWELAFALLAAVVVTLAAWLWLDKRVDSEHDAHLALQNDWDQLKKQRETDVLTSARMPRYMRQMISGELDWMGELSQWSQDGRVRWQSAKMERNRLFLEGVAQDSAAIEAVAAQINARYPQPPLVMSEITSVTVGGEKWWRFSMQVEGANVFYRWILPSKTGGVEPQQVVSDVQKSAEPNTAVSNGETR